jgi:hypothetical protein
VQVKPRVPTKECNLYQRAWLFACSRTWYSFANLVDPGPSRRKLEAEWHQRLKRARSRYERKVAIRKEMLAEHSEWPINLQPDPDGRFALHLALQKESSLSSSFMVRLQRKARIPDCASAVGPAPAAAGGECRRSRPSTRVWLPEPTGLDLDPAPRAPASRTVSLPAADFGRAFRHGSLVLVWE